MKSILFKVINLIFLLIILFSDCRKKNKPPYTPYTPTGSSIGWVDSTYSFSSLAIDPSGDSVAIRFDWGDEDTSDWSNWIPSGNSAWMSHIWVSANNYYIKAQAKNKKEITSDWSLTHAIEIIENLPPYIPLAPIGPWAGLVDTSYIFSSLTVDPDGDSVAIRYDWGNGNISNWSSFVPSGETIRMNYFWSQEGTYYLKAQAKDIDSMTSLWSVSHEITIGLKWRYPTMGSVVSSPAIGADGTIYFGSEDYYLYAVNADGSLKWCYKTDGFIGSSPAIGSDGTIYVGSDDHFLYAINPDGSLKWNINLLAVVRSSPAVGSDGTIYVGAGHYLYAMNPDGGRVWRCQTEWSNDVMSSPAIGSDGTIYFGSRGSGWHIFLYAANPNGSLKWRYKTDDWVESSPAIGLDGTIYVGFFDKYLYAINSDSTLKWRYQTGDGINSSPAIGSDGTIYVGSNDGYLYSINPDGTLKWRYQTGGGVYSSPAIGSNGSIYFGSFDGYFYTINPDGTLKWRIRVGDAVFSSPAISFDGTIYIGSADHCLHAIVGSEILAVTPWPMFHHDLKHSGKTGGP